MTRRLLLAPVVAVPVAVAAVWWRGLAAPVAYGVKCWAAALRLTRPVEEPDIIA